MDTERITNAAVRSAFEAWQGKDLAGWLAHFSADATLTDDGAPRDFQAFSKEIGKGRFTRIDRVEDNGSRIVGQFHSDTWGEFQTFFHFRAGADGKFTRLEIGQA